MNINDIMAEITSLLNQCNGRQLSLVLRMVKAILK